MAVSLASAGLRDIQGTRISSDGRQRIVDMTPPKEFDLKDPNSFSGAKSGEVKEWLTNNGWKYEGLTGKKNTTVGNRLLETVVGAGTPENYTYDNRGNITSGFTHLQSLEYNAENRLEKVVIDGNRTAYYQYDCAGQRVRKTIIDTNTNISETRKYVGEWEVYSKFVSSSLTLERETLHISDDTGRIALIDTRTTGSGSEPAQLLRYQYSNHLGTATLELDDDGAIISYEEYYPYGSTSFQSGRSGAEVSLKRYRYCNSERDEESGLYQMGARYYASWLCRWLSPDPINSENYNLQRGYGLEKNLERDFLELTASTYEYCYDNPVKFNDPNGEQVPYEGINTPIVVDKLRVNRRVIIEDVFFDHTKLHPLKIEEIIKRDEWNAREPIIELGRNYESIEIPLKDYYNTIVIHHSGNSVDYPTVQSVQNEHMDGALNAADIGYHFAIDRYGKIYEGRPIDIVGSHVKSANTGKIGIVLLADLDTEDKGILFDFSDGYVTKEMRESLYRLSIYLIKEYEIEYLGSHKEIINERNCAGNLGQTEVECLRKDTETQKPESIELQKTKPKNKNKNGMQFGPGTIKY